MISLAALVMLATGGLGAFASADHPREIGLIGFGLFGCGAAVTNFRPALGLAARISLSFALSIVVLAAGGFAMMHQTVGWHPVPLYVTVAVFSGLVHLYFLVVLAADALRYVRSSADLLRSSIARSLPEIAALVGVGLCVATAISDRGSALHWYGFIATVGLIWFLGLALVLGSFAFRVLRRQPSGLAVFLLMLCLTLTPAIIYGTPRSQSAEKHVEFVQHIQRFHELNSSVGAYNAWPGFFAGIAWLCNVARLNDPLTLAAYWPPLIGVARVAALRFLIGRVTPAPWVAWLGAGLAVLADPIGADYFSPQSVGFVVGLVICALCLSSGSTFERLLYAFALSCGMTVTHQLSPFIIGGITVLFVVFRQLKPSWTPLLTLGPPVIWVLFHLGVVNKFVSLSSVGSVDNFRPPTTREAVGLSRLPIVHYTSYSLAGGIVLVGLVAVWAVARNRRDVRLWALASAPAVGLVLVATNPYGNEGIFRAALFGVPWLACLAALALAATGRRTMTVLGLVLILALTGTFTVASFGLDKASVIRRGDVEAYRHFESVPGSSTRFRLFLMPLGAGELPSTPRTLKDQHLQVSRAGIGDPVSQEANFDPAATVARLTAELIDYSDVPAGQTGLYTLWSPASSAYDEAYGLQKPAQFAQLRDAFQQSSYWSVALQSGGTYLFKFEPGNYRG